MFHSVADVWVFGNHESLGLVWTLPGWKLNTNKQTHCPGSTFWLPASVILPHYCLLWCGKLYCSTPKDQKRQVNPIPPHDNATTFAHATSLCTSPSFKLNTKLRTSSSGRVNYGNRKVRQAYMPSERASWNSKLKGIQLTPCYHWPK